MENKELVQVKNRNNGIAGYELKEKGINRIFESMEIKKISKDELRAVSYLPGGKRLLQDYLQVLTDDKDFLEELLGTKVEPEYNYSKEDTIDIMLNGSLDKFLDLLDFAPKAILEIVKEESVKLNLNDVAKRNAIKTKTGFDVDKAIQNSKDDKEETVKNTETARERRVPVEDKKERVFKD